jgi:hypothetical protein
MGISKKAVNSGLREVEKTEKRVHNKQKRMCILVSVIGVAVVVLIVIAFGTDWLF